MDAPATLKLPYTDSLGYCNILFVALGGDGANMAAKMLFQMAVEQYDLDGGYDAAYGSEKKGTPTHVTLRLRELGKPVRRGGVTAIPHVLSVFHRQLIKPLELYRGLQPGATVMVNDTLPEEMDDAEWQRRAAELRDELRLETGTIYAMNARRIAVQTGSRLNMPMLALASKILGFDPDLVREAVAYKWPRAKVANLAAFDRAEGEIRVAQFAQANGFKAAAPQPKPKVLGYLNMLNGGAVSALHHSTKNRNNILAGFGHVPEFQAESCNGCANCLTVCSDPGALVWRDGKVVAIDPDYCKGCMRCVEVCRETRLGRALRVATVQV